MDESPIAISVLAHARAHRRVAQGLCRSLIPRRDQPVGEEPRRQADTVRVRRHVSQHIPSGRPLTLEASYGGVPRTVSGAGVVSDVQVRELSPDLARAHDSEELVHRTAQVGVPVAYVAGVHRATRAGHSRQHLELFGGCEAPRSVSESRTEAERACFESLLEMPAHRRDEIRLGVGRGVS